MYSALRRAEYTRRLVSRLPLVKGFLDMTVTYVLSRQWQDLLSIYLFRLHPLPHCSPHDVGYSFLGLVMRGDIGDRPGCSVDADASTQAIFAVGLLLFASAVQGATTKLTQGAPHINDQITSIAGMCVGWGAGDAVIKLLLELRPPAVVVEKAVEPVVAAAATTAVAMASDQAEGGGGGATLRRLLGSAASTGAGSIIFVADESLDRVLFACAYSLAAVLFIILLHPLTTTPSNWADEGEHPVVDALEEMLFSLWSLATRALTTSILMLWTYVSSSNLVEGLQPEQRGSELHWRLLVLWALFLTLAGALVTVKSLRLRESIVADGAREAGTPPSSRSGSPGWKRLVEEAADDDDDDEQHTQAKRNGKPDIVPDKVPVRVPGRLPGPVPDRVPGRVADKVAPPDREPLVATPPPSPPEAGMGAAPPAASASALAAAAIPSCISCCPCCRHLLRPTSDDSSAATMTHLLDAAAGLAATCPSPAWWRKEARTAAVQMLMLFEKVLSWIAGCAWTDVFFASHAADPTGWLTFKDFAVAVALTVLALAWMVLTGGIDDKVLGLEQGSRADGSEVDRSHVESYFLVYSGSFFVGWSWVVVLRDLAAISGQAKLQPIRGDWYGGFAHVLGLETVETVRAAEYSAFARSLLMIIVFGPLLTVLVIWAKHVALRVYGRAGGKNTKQKLMNLLAKAASEDVEISTPVTKRVRTLRHSPYSTKSLLAAAGISTSNAVSPETDTNPKGDGDDGAGGGKVESSSTGADANPDAGPPAPAAGIEKALGPNGETRWSI